MWVIWWRYASLNWVGRSSIEVGVRVIAENPLTGEQTHTNTAYLVYIALGEMAGPLKFPGSSWRPMKNAALD